MSPRLVEIEVKQKDIDLLLAALKHGEQKVLDLGNFIAAENIYKLHQFLHNQIFTYVETE